MTLFLIAVFLTLTVSFVCSLMEALILSTTVSEVEALKRDHPRKGELLENLKLRLEETISTILTLNTIANTLGSVLVGGLALKLFGDAWLGVFSAVMTISILIFSEVIPKNVGVAYRKTLQPKVVRPLTLMVKLLRPVTYLCNVIVRVFMPATTANAHASGDEIILLAQRGAKDGSLTASESNIIANAPSSPPSAAPPTSAKSSPNTPTSPSPASPFTDATSTTSSASSAAATSSKPRPTTSTTTSSKSTCRRSILSPRPRPWPTPSSTS
jgi:CBS domain containing-hemolysin-like protein